jgi:hypothetical protein
MEQQELTMTNKKNYLNKSKLIADDQLCYKK